MKDVDRKDERKVMVITSPVPGKGEVSRFFLIRPDGSQVEVDPQTIKEEDLGGRP